MQIADIATHKESNLSILQLGGTESLTRSLQSMLGGSSNSAARVGTGTHVVAHSDPEWISRTRKEFDESTPGLEFKLFGIETASNQSLENNSFDLVIVASDVSDIEQKLKLLSLLQNVLREGGKAVLWDLHHKSDK